MLKKENCHRLFTIGKLITGIFWLLSAISLGIRSTHGFWKFIRIQLGITVIAHVAQVIWAEKFTDSAKVGKLDLWKIFFNGTFHTLYLRLRNKEG